MSETENIDGKIDSARKYAAFAFKIGMVGMVLALAAIGLSVWALAS